MATPVGRIEKEFLFKALFDEQLPIMYIKDRTEFILTLTRPANEELVLRPDRSLGKLKPRSKLALLFDYRGQVIDFNAEIIAQKEELIYCKAPDTLYKNLDRDFLRVDAPSDLNILFTFRGDRYNLTFPKVHEYESVTAEDLIRTMDPKNLSGLIKQIAGMLNNFADGFKIINFKDKKPDSLEERVVAETGKTLFIPSTVGFLPKTDPYPKKRIITEDIFKRYLESTGVGANYLDENISRIFKNKFSDGIYSDAWVPILFHEYVIGYIHIWIDKQGKLPFDFTILDNVYQYAKVLAFSLKENGYFEHGKVQNQPFDGRVLDISASGLLFACPLGSPLLSTLLVDAELTVTIQAENRTINVVERIVRRFKDKSACYFGCRFTNMEPEDTRFLFEHLYGRQLDSSDSAFLSGQV
ncbi:MAG: PilZ domain-containing protein [Treponema sp.]|nr:PilZ domain-containing protein [Treponema sp.]MCL2237633.1 PilZ domain-containing protein [Treponema sp.]